MSAESRCEGCGALVVWLKTERGSRMICDPELIDVLRPRPLIRGVKRTTIVLEDGRVLVGHRKADIPPLFAPADEDTTATGRIPHWASCPNADTFRRRNAP